MKIVSRLLFTSLFVLFLAVAPAFAGGTAGQVGIGFKVTEQSSVFLARIWVSDKATVEPTFGMTWVDPGHNYSETKRFAPGFGVLYHFRPGMEIRPYLGIRFEAVMLSASDETFADIAIAPLFGAQYFLSDNFSVSGEFNITYLKTDSEFSASMPYADATYINTSQALLVNFYF